MSWELRSRVISIFVTMLLVYTLVENRYWLAVVISFGFAHYALAFFYAGDRIKDLARSSGMAIPLTSLGLLFLIVYFLKFPLELYFGLHHAFNEGYLRRMQPGENRRGRDPLPAAKAMLHFAVYLFVLRNEPYISNIPEVLLWLLLPLSYLMYFNILRRDRAHKRPAALARENPVELALLLVVLLSLVVQIHFLQVVLYHFILWTLIPLPAMKSRGDGALIQYFYLSAAVLILFLALTLSQFNIHVLSLGVLVSQFYLWSYIHITASVALSSAHPDWLVGMFRPVQK